MPDAINRKLVGVIGAGTEDALTNERAHEVGGRLAQAGCSIICGGLEGVMREVARGFQETRTPDSQQIVVGILPSNDPADGNAYLDLAIATGLGEARNSVIVNSAAVYIAVGGGFGTLSEIAYALRLGKTVIGLGSWEVHENIVKVDTPEQAVKAAVEALLAGNSN
ncbi:MAG: hypothetical protein DHS20C16_02630 [Phycisphaerae bacterium]|nr:MAG: hypothetical protein DHS20C16_02630 [Phycisphaerae bacterium]